MKKTIAILLVAILAVSSVFAAFSGEAKIGFGLDLVETLIMANLVSSTNHPTLSLMLILQQLTLKLLQMVISTHQSRQHLLSNSQLAKRNMLRVIRTLVLLLLSELLMMEMFLLLLLLISQKQRSQVKTGT